MNHDDFKMDYDLGRKAGYEQATGIIASMIAKFRPKCKWVPNNIDDTPYSAENDFYNTDCGEEFCFSHDKPFEDGKFKYCPYCGRLIKVKKGKK